MRCVRTRTTTPRGSSSPTGSTRTANPTGPSSSECRLLCQAAAKGQKQVSLAKREQELFAAHKEVWSQPFRGFEVAGSFREFVYDVQFRRGFVWAIDINDEDRRFEGTATGLFQLAPIERINFFHKWSHEDLTRCRELLRVKELGIDRAGFETEEIEVLLRSTFLRNVTRLELIADDDNGHLAPEGIELLSRARTLPSLRHLDLSHNWCGWEGDDGWVGALTKGKFVGQLESLSLRGTLIGDEAAQTLARCKRRLLAPSGIWISRATTLASGVNRGQSRRRKTSPTSRRWIYGKTSRTPIKCVRRKRVGYSRPGSTEES